VSIYEFIGQLFLNALKMLIVPLIASSIALGVAGLGNTDSLGSMGFKTALFYVLTSATAIVTGLIIVNLVQPGIADGQPVGELLALTGNAEEIQTRLAGRGLGEIPQMLLRAVPQNILAAAAANEMLALIFFSGLFGYFMSQIEHELAATLYRFTSGVFETMLMITHWVMNFAPYGVFGLVAAVVAKTGFDAAGPLITFSVAVLVALIIHMFLTLPLYVRVFARRNPILLFKTVAPALLTAFSTSSSSATLPVTMDNLETRAGVPNMYTSFVLPLGATVNMNGTALYECMAAIFIAQAYGVDLSITTQFLIVTIALITSIGVAAVPSASLVAIAIILTAIGLLMPVARLSWRACRVKSCPLLIPTGKPDRPLSWKNSERKASGSTPYRVHSSHGPLCSKISQPMLLSSARAIPVFGQPIISSRSIPLSPLSFSKLKLPDSALPGGTVAGAPATCPVLIAGWMIRNTGTRRFVCNGSCSIPSPRWAGWRKGKPLTAILNNQAPWKSRCFRFSWSA
jgi:Na+/H+-dicarboxylate symporter